MKEFLKYVGATVVGLLLFGIIIAIVGMMSIVGMVSSGQATTTIGENSVLVLDLKGDITELATDGPLDQLMGEDAGSIGMGDLLSAIRKAKNNDDIKGIYLQNSGFTADFAQLQELRDALKDFKQSKKWIVAYGDEYGSGSYYLATVADKVYMNPQGTIDWSGLAAQKVYVKDLLGKVGIRMVPVKVGKYKSATEMFTEDKMSDADRAQTAAYVGGIWNTMVKAVSESRKITPEELNSYADNLIAFDDPQVYKQKRLVDGYLYGDEVKGVVKKLLKADDDKAISQVGVADMRNVKDDGDGDDQIAVYYAEGDIVDEASQSSMFSGASEIVGNDVCRDLEDLMNDDEVKAVVIRVNSGGGSAFASEKMWHQIQMLKKKKPVVVSMSGYAASGGYYMSCGADWIVAEPLTITGSIGIFGMVPDRSGLLTNKLGIKFDEVKTNKNSTIGTPARPMTSEELSFVQASINRGYNLFLQRVATGRKMTIANVNNLAQGHVYLAQDALKLKLVDELGGLDKAVAKAAKLAKTGSFYTLDYPAGKSFLDQLLESTEDKGNYLDEGLRETLGQLYAPIAMIVRANSGNKMQARMPYYLIFN